MINTKKVVENFERMLKIEKRGVELTQKIIDITESPLVSNLMGSIRLDSMKHQLYCQVVIDMFSNKNLLKREQEGMLSLMKQHVQLEKEMLKELQRTIKETDHDFAKALFKDYEADEKRHHKLMEKLMDTLNKLVDERIPVDPSDEKFDIEKMRDLTDLTRFFDWQM